MQDAQDDRSQICLNYVTKGPNVIANISRKCYCCFLYIVCTIYTYTLKFRNLNKSSHIVHWTKKNMLVPFFGPKQSLSYNAIDKFLYLPCIQHKNQNGVAYGCRAATIILRQPTILKSHGYNTSHFMRNIFF